MLLSTLFGAASKADAAMTEWANNEGGRMRIVALPADDSGKIRAALQIEPAPGWITYWREPGDSGIPPQVAITPGSNVALERVDYPAPVSIDIGNVRDIGYDHPVALPLTLSVIDSTQPVELKANAFIGLCKDICIPFQASFDLRIEDTGQSPAEEAVILAVATGALPQAPAEDFNVKAHALSEDSKQLRLELRLPEGAKGAEEVIVTGPPGYAFTSKGAAGARDGIFTLDIPITRLPKNYDPKGKQWQLLVVAGGRAMETTLAFD